MAARSDDVTGLPPEQPTKKHKKRSAIVKCIFNDLYDDCCKHITFLKISLAKSNLMTNVVLKYATIYSLIRVGENLTFFRDDEDFKIRATGEIKEGVIKGFIYLRNRLLHHHLYHPNYDENKLDFIFHQALHGRFNKPTGIEALEKFVGDMRSIAVTLSQTDRIQLHNLNLSKEVGPAPEFAGTIEGCVCALKTETLALQDISMSRSELALTASHAALLRCFQALSNLRKTQAVKTQPDILMGFATLFDNAALCREHLAHYLSFDTEERKEVEKLLKEFNADVLLNFVTVITARLEEIKKTNSVKQIKLPGPSAPKLLEEASSVPVKVKVKKQHHKKPEAATQEHEKTESKPQLVTYSDSESEGAQNISAPVTPAAPADARRFVLPLSTYDPELSPKGATKLCPPITHNKTLEETSLDFRALGAAASKEPEKPIDKQAKEEDTEKKGNKELKLK